MVKVKALFEPWAICEAGNDGDKCTNKAHYQLVIALNGAKGESISMRVCANHCEDVLCQLTEECRVLARTGVLKIKKEQGT